jgi:UDP-N-acetylmuramoylalanine--D-glutamate ligase
MSAIASHYRHRRLAILGLGASGVAAARLARAVGADVCVLDSGDSPSVHRQAETLRAEGYTCMIGEAALRYADPVDLGILSPGIDPSWPLARLLTDRGISCLGEVEFAIQHTDIPYIAITGTNGKTTTTELATALLNGAGKKAIACGNYGLPVSDVVRSGIAYDILVIEASSFQLESIDTFRPQVAVWMNFAPDHLDRHPTLEAYYAAKFRIFENQEASDTAVVNGAEAYASLAARRVTFSAYASGMDYGYADGTISFGGHAICRLSETKLRGLHNAENIMAAMAAAHVMGVAFADMTETLRNYQPPAHRCALAGTVGGIEFINDSKATNVHAMESALRGMTGRVILIAGGKEKNLDYAPVTPLVGEKTTHVFAIGEIREALVRTWRHATQCIACESLEAAVQAARKAAQPGQTVLFAPGTSSFDMFTGYDHRGRVFTDIVNQLN